MSTSACSTTSCGSSAASRSSGSAPTPRSCVLAALDVWRNVGYWAIFFVAAIIGLPTELYQAAELDGASALARFRYLTLPLLRRIIFFAIVVSTIWGLQVFDTALVLTNGGPGTATTTVVYRVWHYVFGSNDKVGFASAISLVLIVAILTLTLIQMRLLARSPRRRLMAALASLPTARRRRGRSRPHPAAPAPAAREFARHLLLIVVTFVLVAPFYYVILASLKNSTAIFSYPPRLLPIPALSRQLRASSCGHRLPALDVQHAVRRHHA